MWARFKRAVRSWFGSILSAGEDPKLMLEQNLRDMQDQLAEIKASEARALGAAERVEREQAPLKTRGEELTGNIKSLLEQGDEGAAAELALELQKVRAQLEVKKSEGVAARENHLRMTQLREGYEKELARRKVEAKAVIQEAEAAKLKQDLVSLQQSFEVADIAGTHDEMMDKLRREKEFSPGVSTSSATPNEAPNEAAQNVEAEKKFEDLESQKLLEEFKKDMGMSKEQNIPLDPLPDKDNP